jgi:hypothetical protein
MNEELTTFIIKQLGKHRNRRDIIQKLCQQGGLNWREAERLLFLVEARHKRSIVPDKSPWLLFLSIGALILGIGLMGFNLQILLAIFHQDVLEQILSLQSSSYRMIGLITGLGMTVGGLVGLWKAFGTIFPE